MNFHRHPTDPKTFVVQDVLDLLSDLAHMPDICMPSLERLTVHDLTTLKYCLDMATTRMEKAK